MKAVSEAARKLKEAKYNQFRCLATKMKIIKRRRKNFRGGVYRALVHTTLGDHSTQDNQKQIQAHITPHTHSSGFSSEAAPPCFLACLMQCKPLATNSNKLRKIRYQARAAR